MYLKWKVGSCSPNQATTALQELSYRFTSVYVQQLALTYTDLNHHPYYTQRNHATAGSNSRPSGDPRHGHRS
jgi:hypothetical protein